MKLRREQPVARTASAAARTSALRARIGLPLPGLLQRGDLLAELGLAAGAVHHLALELAAGGVDVVPARAPDRGNAAGVVEQLLEAADGGVLRTLVARARERVERNQ